MVLMLLLSSDGRRVFLLGGSTLLPFLGKIFGIMPLFENYIGACPCFDTRLYDNRVT